MDGDERYQAETKALLEQLLPAVLETLKSAGVQNIARKTDR